MTYRYNLDVIKGIIERCYSYAQVLREINVVPAGGNYATLKDFIKENSIDISHFTGKLWSKNA